MENNVVTLQTAQKLRAAGFPHYATINYWHEQGQAHSWLNQSSNSAGLSIYHIEDIAAPTAQEIADQLPINTAVLKQEGGYYADFPKTDPNGLAPTMAEALAQLYLKLNEAKQ